MLKTNRKHASTDWPRRCSHNGHLRMELPNLSQKQGSEQLLVQLLLHLEIQQDLALGSCLQTPVPHRREQLMLKCLRDGDALLWIEDQHLLQQIAPHRVHVPELGLNTATRFLPEAFHVALGIFFLKIFDVLCRRRTKQGENHAELVTISFRVVLGVGLVRLMRRKREARVAREEGSSILVLLPLEHAQELSIDATNRPHVDGLCIVFLHKNELGCAVPPGHDMAREVPPLGQQLITHIERLAGRHAKAKVADLYATILVDKAVSWLQVPVPNACRVQVVQAHEQVVEQTRDVQIVQVHLRADQFLEV
mmetsp:Transcript_32224/g.102192  ORF Transcript_32224/g.102192 Transcript_32224/m.102192 type:complete len:308 (-) Transcript_32224:472-1395(-)